MDTPQFLIMAPQGRDAAVIASQLEKAGMTSVTVSGEELLAAIAANDLSSAILTIEALRSLDAAALEKSLTAQAPWSDCPLIVLALRSDRAGARAALDSFGNLVMLERPLRAQSLVRAATQALRVRKRQSQAAAYLRHQQAAEAQLRVMAETLETRVIARTIQLTDSLAERAMIAAQLSASEEQYRLTVELGNQTPWSADEDGGMLSVGAGWVNLAGAPATSVTRDGWMARVHPDDIERVVEEWRAARMSGAPLDIDLRLKMPDGNFRSHRARAAAQFRADRSIAKWYGTIEDVEDSRQAEMRLQALQVELANTSRLSAMGAMASTLAHELNQPLTATTSYLRGIRRLLEQDPAVQADLIEAVNGADRSATRAGEIVRRLRDMVSGGGVAPRPERLGTLVREACALAHLDITSHGISHIIAIADEELLVDVDRIQIQQVLLNLLRNAIEALSCGVGGEITISAGSIGEFSEIIVSDDGPGIPVTTAERLFEPFNTSKPDGMGIGLAISRTIVEAHGGRISCDPSCETGAVFRFTVPIAREGAGSMDEPASSQNS